MLREEKAFVVKLCCVDTASTLRRHYNDTAHVEAAPILASTNLPTDREIASHPHISEFVRRHKH